METLTVCHESLPTIEDLKDDLSKLPQLDTDFQTDHYIINGMYIRKMTMPAGSLIVSKKHKSHHMFVCASGSLLFRDEKGSHVINGGDIFESFPNTCRLVYVLKESTCITIHRTDKTNLEDIEVELIEPDDMALYDFNNELVKKEIK